MSKLYTSLVHAKLMLNGGELRPMTPIPERYHDTIDPEFTIGLGALREVEGKGLQCPVRGCGVWRHSLTKHANAAHRDIGGSHGIKRRLSIPQSAKLVSQQLQRNVGDATRARIAAGVVGCIGTGRYQRYHNALNATARAGKKRSITRRRTIATTGHRNLHNSCEAQVAHRMLDLQARIGRSPSRDEANALGERQLVRACISIYGSWNAAKLHVGMDVMKPGQTRNEYTRDDIVERFRLYYEANCRLPTSLAVMKKLCLPILPHTSTVYKHFPNKSWPEIMDHMAWKIGVTGGRYGKPEYAKKTTEAA